MLIILSILLTISIIVNFYLYQKNNQNSLKQDILQKWEETVNNKKDEVAILDETIKKNQEFIQHQIDSTDDYWNQIKSCENKLADLNKSFETQRFDLDRKFQIYKDSISNQKIELEQSIGDIVECHLEQEKTLRQVISSHEKKIQAYIEEEKRKEEKANNINFYRLVLSDNEMTDIKKLINISETLTNPDILRKLIYKTYFEKKMNDLLGRVVGSNSEVSAIYKITHIESNKAYIGQTTNVKDRWRTHLKRGLNIDTPSTNKFYQSMIELKPWNFTWEIIETCPKDQLNEKEKYWIDFFQTNSWGWNSKGGNK